VSGLRERKKLETRQRLADLATTLFVERGFDNVSVADVAEAAGVSKMTVFNYFPRKEDLFFDRGPEVEALITTAVRERPAGEPPVAALRDLILRMLDARHPMGGISDTFPIWWQVVMDSPALTRRARAVVDEGEELLAVLFAETYAEPHARLAAALTVAAWRAAFMDGFRRLVAGERAADFEAEQRAWVGQCFGAVLAATRDLPERQAGSAPRSARSSRRSPGVSTS
jgi:AcrR family transcriptional regulator